MINQSASSFGASAPCVLVRVSGSTVKVRLSDGKLITISTLSNATSLSDPAVSEKEKDSSRFAILSVENKHIYMK